MQNFFKNEEASEEHGWFRQFSASRWHHEPKTVWMLGWYGLGWVSDW